MSIKYLNLDNLVEQYEIETLIKVEYYERFG